MTRAAVVATGMQRWLQTSRWSRVLITVFCAATCQACGEERITPASAVRDLPTLMRFLDEYEANVQDHTGQAVLHWAASTGYTDAINYAIGQGADVMLPDADGRTPLHIAALSGHGAAVDVLLQHGARADVQDDAGALPLHRAALAGSAGAARSLAKAALEQVDARFSRTDGTALHSAAYLGHVRVLEALLDAGASPCARNGAGELPIDRFVEEDEDEVAKVFEEEPVVEKKARRRVLALLQGGTLGCGADL